MNRLLLFGVPILMVAGLLLSGISDTSTSIADTGIPDDDPTSSVNDGNDSGSASATITITMRTAP